MGKDYAWKIVIQRRTINNSVEYAISREEEVYCQLGRSYAKLVNGHYVLFSAKGHVFDVVNQQDREEVDKKLYQNAFEFANKLLNENNKGLSDECKKVILEDRVSS